MSGDPGSDDGSDARRIAVGVALATFVGAFVTGGGAAPAERVALAALAGGVGFVTVLALHRVDEFVPLPIERWR